jgi:BMFP domain-containing protein YqiC
MGLNPNDQPTAGDYAWAEAQKARDENASLAHRITVLEGHVARLQKALSEHLLAARH